MLRRLPGPAGPLINPQYNFMRLDYWFGQVESRPLSLFRIFFGLLVVKTALYSIPLAQLFYSDEGIVPRAQFWDEPTQYGLGHFSLLNYVSAPWMAVLFFALWAAIGVALLLGYRTRLMTVLNYAIKLSILNRNQFPLTGADHVITVLSFWIMFLPLDQHYSVAAWLAHRGARAGRRAAAAMGSTAFAFPLRLVQIQIALIYVFTSYYKWQGEYWRSGDALYYTFQQVGYLLPPGTWLGANGPLWLLHLLTWSTLLIEAAFAILIFSPALQPWARACGLLLAAAMHLGIAITMSIPDFSLVMWISYLLFFDPSWVLWLERRLRRLLRLPPLEAGASAAGPAGPVAARRGAALRLVPALRRGTLALALLVVLAATIWGGIEEGRTLRSRVAPPMPAWLKAIDGQLQLASAWKMFVYPVIPRAGWLMVNGQFEDGAEALLYSGADPATGAVYRLWGPDARLRLLEQHLLSSMPTPILRAWAGYYCRLFNDAAGRPAGQRLAALTISLHYRWSHLPGAPPNAFADDVLWRHRCLTP
ncbi:MAG: HTTM domain-containing protein [Caldilineaceae bacterium]